MEWKIHAKEVCYSSEPDRAGQHHLPWKVDVHAEHMEVFFKFHNNVQAHYELCGIICDKMQPHALIKVKLKQVRSIQQHLHGIPHT